MSKGKPTKKQQAFIDEYMKCFNASGAARRVGYSPKSARQTGSDLLATPYISEQIRLRMEEIHMTTNEALKLQADIARGDIGDLLDNNGLLDLRVAREKGMTKLIKKIKQKTVTRIGKTDTDDDIEITEIEFEMYPADAAHERILRIHGKFKDIGSKDNPLTIDDKTMSDEERIAKIVELLQVAKDRANK